MVGPSHDCTAKDPRCFHCILTDVLLSSEDRDEESFERRQQVRVQTDQVGNKKVLAEALDRRCSNINGPPFHRHIVMDGGIAKMASAYTPELVTTVLRALRQQMLDGGWISDLELQFAGPSPSKPVFDFKPLNGRMTLMTTREHSFQVNWCTQERCKRFVG